MGMGKGKLGTQLTVGLSWHQPFWDATAHAIADVRGHVTAPKGVRVPNPKEFLIPEDSVVGGWGDSAPLNADQIADALSLAAIATLAGDAAVADACTKRADSLTSAMVTSLWDDEVSFVYEVMVDPPAWGRGRGVDRRPRTSPGPGALPTSIKARQPRREMRVCGHDVAA